MRPFLSAHRPGKTTYHKLRGDVVGVHCLRSRPIRDDRTASKLRNVAASTLCRDALHSMQKNGGGRDALFFADVVRANALSGLLARLSLGRTRGVGGRQGSDFDVF